MWREQFIPLMGQEEVVKLDNKLKSLNVAGKYSRLTLVFIIFEPDYILCEPDYMLSVM